jgi:hypothetical protein
MKPSGARTSIQPTEYRKKADLLLQFIKDKPQLSPAKPRARLEELETMGIVRYTKGGWVVIFSVPHEIWKRLDPEKPTNL